MEPRLNYQTASPEAIKGMYELEHYVHSSGLDPKLLHLIKTRASQMNGCAFCLDMHTKDARAVGETEQRLYALNAWRETPFFTDQERAALAWTEALTNIQQGHAPDEVYQELGRHFSEKDIVVLTLAITTINAWNRLAIGFRVPPGTYQPKQITRKFAPSSPAGQPLEQRASKAAEKRQSLIGRHFSAGIKATKSTGL